MKVVESRSRLGRRCPMVCRDGSICGDAVVKMVWLWLLWDVACYTAATKSVSIELDLVSY